MTGRPSFLPVCVPHTGPCTQKVRYPGWTQQRDAGAALATACSVLPGALRHWPLLVPHANLGARWRGVPCPPPRSVPARDRVGFDGSEVRRFHPAFQAGGVQAAKVVRPDVGDAWGVPVELDPIVATRLVEVDFLTNPIQERVSGRPALDCSSKGALGVGPDS